MSGLASASQLSTAIRAELSKNSKQLLSVLSGPIHYSVFTENMRQIQIQ